jgi:hypothetical protein
MTVKDGDEVAFLVKRVTYTSEIKGFLKFLGVLLVRILGRISTSKMA